MDSKPEKMKNHSVKINNFDGGVTGQAVSNEFRTGVSLQSS